MIFKSSTIFPQTQKFVNLAIAGTDANETFWNRRVKKKFVLLKNISRYDAPESDSNRSSVTKAEIPEIPETRGPRPELPVKVTEFEIPQDIAKEPCPEAEKVPKVFFNCVFIASVFMIL